MLDTFISLLEFTSKIVLPVVAYCLTHGVIILGGIRDELRTINGRLIKLEEWRLIHDKSDEIRFDTFETHVAALTLKVDTRYRR